MTCCSTSTLAIHRTWLMEQGIYLLLQTNTNLSSVVRSRDWRERLMDHPALMAEVMEAMARKEAGESLNKRPSQGQAQASQDNQGKRSKCSSSTPIRLQN